MKKILKGIKISNICSDTSVARLSVRKSRIGMFDLTVPNNDINSNPYRKTTKFKFYLEIYNAKAFFSTGVDDGPCSCLNEEEVFGEENTFLFKLEVCFSG